MADSIVTAPNPGYQLGNGGVSQTIFPTSTDALNAFSGLYPTSFVANVAGYLKSNRYVYGRVDWLYNFTDQGDGNTLKALYLPVIVYPDGQVRNLGMRVVSFTTQILYFVYHSLATDASLPASWTYPDGGHLYEWVLDKNLNAISGPTDTNTGGAYDESAPGSNNNDGLVNLIRNVVSPQITNYTALYAIVDYARSVSPVWDCDSNGKCTAEVFVDSSSRTVHDNQCWQQTTPNNPFGPQTPVNTLLSEWYTYECAGAKGYGLQYTSDRFIVMPYPCTPTSCTYSQTASSTGYDISPIVASQTGSPVGSTPKSTVTFDNTIPLSSSSVPATEMADPFGTSTMYDYTNDTTNNLPCSHYIYNNAQCMQVPVQGDVVQFWYPNCQVSCTCSVVVCAFSSGCGSCSAQPGGSCSTPNYLSVWPFDNMCNLFGAEPPGTSAGMAGIFTITNSSVCPSATSP